MHELGLLSGVVSAVEDTTDRRVLEVGLSVGELSDVVEESLYAAWPLAIAGTRCAEARLQVTMIPATVFCPTCNAEQHIDEFFALSCPVCGTPTADLRHGREFSLDYVDVE